MANTETHIWDGLSCWVPTRRQLFRSPRANYLEPSTLESRLYHDTGATGQTMMEITGAAAI